MLPHCLGTPKKYDQITHHYETHSSEQCSSSHLSHPLHPGRTHLILLSDPAYILNYWEPITYYVPTSRLTLRLCCPKLWAADYCSRVEGRGGRFIINVVFGSKVIGIIGGCRPHQLWVHLIVLLLLPRGSANQTAVLQCLTCTRVPIILRTSILSHTMAPVTLRFSAGPMVEHVGAWTSQLLAGALSRR